jgi:hypothetical protein
MGLVDGASLPEVLATATVCLRLAPRHEETLAAIKMAKNFASSVGRRMGR